MKQKVFLAPCLATLRTSIESNRKKQPKEPVFSHADADRERLIQEMQIYQIKLEAQNEELKKLRSDAEILAEKYIDIYDFSPIGYLSLDSLGFITIANLKAAKLLGTNRVTLTGKLFFDWLTEQSLNTFNDFLKEIFRTGNPATCELSLNIPGHSEVIVQVKANISPSTTECRLALIDITKQKKAEDALRRGETILRNVFETNPVGLCIMKDEIFQSINKAWTKICGYSESYVIGNNLQIFFEQENEYNRIKNELFTNLKERGFASDQTEFRHKDGNMRNVILTAVPLHLDDLSLSMALVTVEDITERKLAEDALEKEKQRLEETNRELESFSYSVSHDLQAPLRAIEGFSRMILKRQSRRFDDETARKFQIIMNNVKKMEELISDLLDFSRLERRDISKAKFEVTDLIQEVWEEIISINPERIMTIKIEEVPPCFADRALIKQVIGNILGNAVKFSGSRNVIRIEAGCKTQKGEIAYFIRDNGVGFDMAYYDRLFTIFKTLHDRKEYAGTGVGLALAQRIINRHGGRIWAENNSDKGATFYFSIPCPHR